MLTGVFIIVKIKYSLLGTRAPRETKIFPRLLYFSSFMPTRIDDLLRMAMSFGASDLHLRAGSYPVIRVNGELRPVSGISRLDQEETLEMAFSMMSNRQKMHFKEAFEVDIGY